MRGTQNPQAVEDGAQEFRQRNSRPLSRPSPSANLVGNWKGDPLGFRSAKSPRSPRHKRVVPAHGDNPARTRPHRSWVMTTNVLFAAAGVATPVLVIVGFIVFGLML